MKLKPPYSTRQELWAFAAEERGELPRGTAHKLAHRAKRRAFGDARIIVKELPDGWPHARSSVKMIGQLIDAGSHDWTIRQLATQITKDIASKSPTAEIYAIYKWVRKNIRYRHDPLDLEMLQGATRTIKEGAGDCDCMTILIGSLARSLGHKVTIRTVGKTLHSPEHVAALVWDKKRWISVDPVLEPPGDTGQNEPGLFSAYAPGPSTIWNLKGKEMSNTFGIPATGQDLALISKSGLAPASDAPRPDLRYDRFPEPLFGKCDRSSNYYPANHYAGEMDGLFDFVTDIAAAVIPGGGLIKSGVKAIAGLVGGGKKGAAPPAGSQPLTPIDAKTANKLIKGQKKELAVEKKQLAETKKTDKILLLMAQNQGAQSAAVQDRLDNLISATHGNPAMTADVDHVAKLLSSERRAKKELAAKRAAAEKQRKHDSAIRTSIIRKLKAKAAKKKAKIDALKTTRAIARNQAAQVLKKAKVSHGRVTLGAFKPQVTFTLGEFGDDRYNRIAALTTAAQQAITAIQNFIKYDAQHRSPQWPLAAIKNFQATDGTLGKPDGVYGPNTRAAAAWYLKRSDLPPVSPVYQKYAVTWTPPAAPVVVKPAPKPADVAAPPTPPLIAPAPVPRAIPTPTKPVIVAPAPSTLMQTALACLARIRKFVSITGRSPEIVLMETAGFQKAAGLKADGLYGPTTALRLAQVTGQKVPPPPAAFTSPKAAPIVIRPAPAPSPFEITIPPAPIVIPPAPAPSPFAITTPPAPIVEPSPPIPSNGTRNGRRAEPIRLPTVAEIRYLQIASCRGDVELCRALARVNRAVSKSLPAETPTKSKGKNLWPILALAAIA